MRFYAELLDCEREELTAGHVTFGTPVMIEEGKHKGKWGIVSRGEGVQLIGNTDFVAYGTRVSILPFNKTLSITAGLE